VTGRFAGVTALVTGAASGIGAAVTRRLTGEGASVIAVDRDEPALTRCYEDDPPVTPYVLDLRAGVPDDLFTGRDVSVLVNAAGILRRSPVEDHTLADWEDTLAVNLTAPHRLSQLFVRELLRRRTTGSVVNVCSIESFTTLPAHTAYTVSKSALLMLTRSFALELAPHGIRVNAIAPGLIMDEVITEPVGHHPYADAMLRATPLGRTGRPDDVAQAAVFLASDRTAWVTGTIFEVTGGAHCGRPHVPLSGDMR
jgi:NAD(P)-dependent dehydrogenase (short-subunit alcohol dehydrogenase family)